MWKISKSRSFNFFLTGLNINKIPSSRNDIQLKSDHPKRPVSQTRVNMENRETAKAAGAAGAAAKGAEIGKKAEKAKGFTNPALQMMGIRRIRLPSRNWTLFGCAVCAFVCGAFYDRQKQKEQRAKLMACVSAGGEERYSASRIPRKVRIYAAPPPNDYLSETMKYFRRFVKPMLNASGIDFELISEDRQGRIRSTVAEEIRKLRRKKLGLPDKSPEEVAAEKGKKEEADKAAKEKGGNKNLMNINPSFGMAMSGIGGQDAKQLGTEKQEAEKLDEDGHEIKAVKDLYSPGDVLGLTRFLKDSPEIKVRSDDETEGSARESGGIICLGRGAYKEYINGVHEGLLGPVYEPENVKAAKAAVAEERRKAEKPDSELTEKQRKRRDQERERQEKEDLAKPAPPYILPGQYKEADIAQELEVAGNPRDENGQYYFFLEPILVLRLYTVAGFTKLPERIRRFYTKRRQQVEYGERVNGLVEKKHRQFCPGDVDWEAAEEDDWPGPWVKRGREKNSEWCREFKVDSRVAELLAVYEKEPIDLDGVVTPEKKPGEKWGRKPWV